VWSFVVLFLSCVYVCVTCFSSTLTIVGLTLTLTLRAHQQTGATLRVLGSCGFQPANCKTVVSNVNTLHHCRL